MIICICLTSDMKGFTVKMISLGVAIFMSFYKDSMYK